MSDHQDHGDAPEGRRSSDPSAAGHGERSRSPKDPSSRRHVGTSMTLIGAICGLLTVVVVVVVVRAIWGSWALALGLGIAVALGGGFLGALLVAEREDGRIEDEVAVRSPEAGG